MFPLLDNGTDIDSFLKQETDDQLIMQTGIDYPWQQLIASGPSAINILGQLLVISTKIDFSLKDSAGSYQFQYIRHPQSYRATLVQITNDGYEAFRNAHSSMNTIQLYMAQIPGHIKTSLRILTSASQRLVQRMLVPSLNNIERIGRQCSKLASDTDDQFVNVMQLLGEVVEVTALTQGVHLQQFKEVEIQLNVSKATEHFQQKIIETVEKHYNEAQSACTKALKDRPVGWNKILQNLASAVVDIIRVVVPGMITQRSTTANQGVSETSGGDPEINLGQQVVSDQALNYANTLYEQLIVLKELISESTANSSVQAFESRFATLRVGFNAINNLLNSIKGNNELIQKVKGFLQSAIEQIKNGLTTLITDLKPLAAAKLLLSDEGFKSGASSSQHQSSNTYANEQFKVTITLNRLQQAEQRYDQIFEQLTEQQNQMKSLMVQIAGLNLAKINYEEIIELLRQAILLLGNIRSQWSRLVEFFSEVSIRTQTTTNETLMPFVERINEVTSIEDITESERTFYLELLRFQAIDIHRETYILYIMSRTYVDISREFMMDKLSGLAGMLAMQTDQDRERAVKQLLKDTDEAEAKINALANERKLTFTAKLVERKNELETYLNSIGGKTQEDLDAINKAEGLLQGLI